MFSQKRSFLKNVFETFLSRGTARYHCEGTLKKNLFVKNVSFEKNVKLKKNVKKTFLKMFSKKRSFLANVFETCLAGAPRDTAVKVTATYTHVQN